MAQQIKNQICGRCKDDGKDGQNVRCKNRLQRWSEPVTNFLKSLILGIFRLISKSAAWWKWVVSVYFGIEDKNLDGIFLGTIVKNV